MIFMSNEIGLLFYYFQCPLRLVGWWPVWRLGGGEKGISSNYQCAKVSVFWDVT